MTTVQFIKTTSKILTTLITRALQNAGCVKAQAFSAAQHLVRAECEGQIGHGIRRTPSYVEQLKCGKVIGHAVPIFNKIGPGWGLIDAGHGFAYSACDLAVKHLFELCKAQMIAGISITNSHHSGVGGHFVSELAKQGLIAMMFTNSPAAMPVFGSHKRFYGTNPIAFAAPRPDNEPLVIDLSLSKVARGKIMAAKQQNKPIPEGWAKDCDGNPTTDPDQAIAGTMVAIGDAKGPALALMVEILASILSGANFSYQMSSFLDNKGDKPNAGQLLIGFDVEAIAGKQALKRINDIALAIESMDDCRLPGSRAQNLYKKSIENDIQIDADFFDRLKALAST
ncbi:MAG: Ldh family oxidoreductase [Pseudomonadota bacterium]